MRVHWPTTNKITQSYSPTHQGIDFSGNPEKQLLCVLKNATVVMVKDWESRNWLANTTSDPWYVPGVRRPLKTEDYGNYVRLKGTSNDGYVCYMFYAHLASNSVKYQLNQAVPFGAHLADIGNTGNSTGAHLHFELRNSSNTKVQPQFDNYPDFVDTTPVTPNEQMFIRLLKEGSVNLEVNEGRLREYVGFISNYELLERDKRNADNEITALKLKIKQLESGVSPDPSLPPSGFTKQDLAELLRTLANLAEV